VSRKELEWLALRIKSREEKRARENLSNQGFESYFPVIHSLIATKGNDELKKESMFPGYAFVRLTPNIDLKSLNSTRGVINIVRFGDEYPLLSQDTISSIQNAEDQSFKDPKQHSYKIGEKIIINEGPLKDQSGIIASEIINQRVEILYSLLNRAHLARIQIDKISRS
tara:strand:+ start:145 stop:648 length:504 start_codon:yes stop_codon:yes gene_type:complete